MKKFGYWWLDDDDENHGHPKPVKIITPPQAQLREKKPFASNLIKIAPEKKKFESNQIIIRESD